MRKILAAPLYLAGAIASTIVSRTPGAWVFGSGSGVGEGALALYDFARKRAHSEGLELLWLTGSEREAQDAAARGIPTLPKAGWRGLAATLRAHVIVVTHGFGDVNRFATRGAFVVQLWHGIPLKRIQLDSPVTFSSPVPLLRSVLRRAYRRSSRGISLVAAASESSAERLRTAFGLPAERVVVTGDPRDDVLFATTQSSARAQLGVTSARAVLYAPTWRDGAADPAIPSAAEWLAIDAWLGENDATLFVRPHPHGVGDYAAGMTELQNVRLLSSRELPDVTPALPAFDTLVTDYSSIALDFALTGGTIAFLAPDAHAYATSRGLYEPYAAFSGGTEVSTWGALLALLDEREPALRAHAKSLAARYHSFHDGRNTARVYDAVTSRISSTAEGTRMTPSMSESTTLTGVTALSVEVIDDELLVSGAVDDLAPTSLSLVGRRVRLDASVMVSDQRWSARLPLRAARWGSEPLAAPSGHYTLLATTADGETPVPLIGEPVNLLVPGLTRLSVSAAGVELSPPLRDNERGAANQARLETEYRRAKLPIEDAVFFESFYGQNASCNPRALDAALATLQPHTTRYWSVADLSVEVPAGAIAIVEGSAEWWRVRGTARLIVINDWLRKRYRPRRGQKVLQTWHGTMLKRIAMDRPNHGLRAGIATVLESRRWDLLLSQNPHSTAIFRSAYRYRGPVLELGYPRDDALATGDGASIREKLGVAADATIVLYAPTWRDDRLDRLDHLDLDAFTKDLGPNHVTLVRGHSRTLKPGRDVLSANVIDVTSYPDVTELFLAADVLVTDYSSVMFDFAVTGKPMLFFTPDLEHYRESLRGFYFDLNAVAPGPLTSDVAELARLVHDRDAVATEYAERYAAWRERFTPHDDGHASERVLARLTELGAL